MSLVWLDNSSHETEYCTSAENCFHRIDRNFTRLRDENEWIEFSKSSNNDTSMIILIINNELGKQLVPKIESSTRVSKIYILYAEKPTDDEWIKNYKKVLL